MDGRSEMVPEQVRVPVFPLENVVLFPGLQVPLHIFEARYRSMTSAALAGDRRIAMAVVRPEFRAEMHGNPPLFPICCEGSVLRAEQLADGRFNILLGGTRRLRILHEDPTSDERPYRVALAQPLEDHEPEDERVRIRALRSETFAMLQQLVARVAPARASVLEQQRLDRVDDRTFVNTIAQSMDFPVSEKQALLEADSIRERYERLSSLLRFRLAEVTRGGVEGPDALQ